MIIVNGRNKLEWVEGMTVQDVMDKMGYDYSLITVTVNNEIVSEDEYDSYKVADASDVKAIHLCHGG
ncbi:sulfur carrier protein ThiS [bacterium]|nr:sulfur carrier protein ThiS [bacterium]